MSRDCVTLVRRHNLRHTVVAAKVKLIDHAVLGNIGQLKKCVYECVTANDACVVEVKVSLEQATKAQRGSRGIALPFL
jgi:transcriptional regulator with AAA-type ATPase domain